MSIWGKVGRGLKGSSAGLSQGMNLVSFMEQMKELERKRKTRTEKESAISEWKGFAKGAESKPAPDVPEQAAFGLSGTPDTAGTGGASFGAGQMLASGVDMNKLMEGMDKLKTTKSTPNMQELMSKALALGVTADVMPQQKAIQAEQQRVKNEEAAKMKQTMSDDALLELDDIAKAESANYPQGSPEWAALYGVRNNVVEGDLPAAQIAWNEYRQMIGMETTEEAKTRGRLKAGGGSREKRTLINMSDPALKFVSPFLAMEESDIKDWVLPETDSDGVTYPSKFMQMPEFQEAEKWERVAMLQALNKRLKSSALEAIINAALSGAGRGE